MRIGIQVRENKLNLHRDSMHLDDSMKSQESLIRNQRYSISIEKDEGETFVKFTVIPNSYTLISVMNFFMLLVLNSIAMRIFLEKLELSVYKALAFRLAIFAITSLVLRKPTIDSVIVIRNYGVQVTKISGIVVCPNSWITPWIEKSNFLPKDSIVDIIINEGFVKNQQVIFYLAILVREAKRLTLLFSVCAL